MPHMTLTPGERAPALKVPALGGPGIDLPAGGTGRMTLLFFYRGHHCPLCKAQLEELNANMDRFAQAGIDVHVASMDPLERAEKQKADWAVDRLVLGYALDEAQARAWGLFLSPQDRPHEPEIFCEPGTVVIRPDGRIWVYFVQNVPFFRPMPLGMLDRIGFLQDNDYPIRGRL